MNLKFSRLLGERAPLYYCNELNRFQLGNVLFEVIEDEQDGYRSSCEDVDVVSMEMPTDSGDFLAEITIVERLDNDAHTYHLVDDLGHDWVVFGTNNYDDYYPYFVFNRYAK